MTNLKPYTQPSAQCAHGDDCATGAPGHGLTFIQQRLASASSSKWRDGFVSEISEDGWVIVSTLDNGANVLVWHHADLTSTARVGDPVALHGSFDVLAIGRDWVNVLVASETHS